MQIIISLFLHFLLLVSIVLRIVLSCLWHNGCRVNELIIARLGRWNINVQHSNYATDMPLKGLLL